MWRVTMWGGWPEQAKSHAHHVKPVADKKHIKCDLSPQSCVEPYIGILQPESVKTCPSVMTNARILCSQKRRKTLVLAKSG